MPRFEIVIPGEAPGAFQMTLELEADHWIAALHLACEELGAEGLVQSGVLEPTGEGMQLVDPDAGRKMRVRRLFDQGTSSEESDLPDTGEMIAEWLGLDADANDTVPGNLPVFVDDAPTRRTGARVRRPAPPPPAPSRPMGGPRRRATVPGARALGPISRPAALGRTAVSDRRLEEALRGSDTSPDNEAPTVEESEAEGRSEQARALLAVEVPPPSLANLPQALESLDPQRMSAEQLIDTAVELVATYLEVESVQCLLPQQGGEGGWRVVDARGPRSTTFLLCKILLSEPPMSSWAGALDRAVHVASPGLVLRYEGRDGRPHELSADQLAMIPVHDGRIERAVLLVTGGQEQPVFTTEALDAIREIAVRLGKTLALRM